MRIRGRRRLGKIHVVHCQAVQEPQKSGKGLSQPRLAREILALPASECPESAGVRRRSRDRLDGGLAGERLETVGGRNGSRGSVSRSGKTPSDLSPSANTRPAEGFG